MKSRLASADSLKDFLRKMPLLGSAARKLASTPVIARLRRRLGFPGSATYWESRYRDGGTSGAGSYGRLAEFKAEILNEFVRANGINTVIEFGCGDGAQLELAEYPEYVGVDIAATSVERCSQRFARDKNKKFYLTESLPPGIGRFDLALSLDVIYHLIEDPIFDIYMHRLFDASEKFVAIYASNFDAPSEAPHVRHRKFTTWVAVNAPAWHPAGHVPNRFPLDPARPDDTSFADFYFFVRHSS